MSFSASRSLRNLSCGGASALLLFAVASASPAFALEKTITDTLKGFGGSSQTLDIPNFDASSETLLDVTFTLMLGNKDVTLYNAQDPKEDLLNVSLSTPGHSSFKATSLASWDVPTGKLKVIYTENTSHLSNDGAAAQLLFGTHGNLSGRNVDVNFLCLESGGSNSGGHPLGGDGNMPGGCGNGPGGNGDPLGNPSAVPEPGVNYLSFLAAGAMTLLLFGRNWLQRTTARRD